MTEVQMEAIESLQEALKHNDILKFNFDKKWVARKPKGIREGFDGELVCDHRNRSVCPECATLVANIYEVGGEHYWFRNVEEAIWVMTQMEPYGEDDE